MYVPQDHQVIIYDVWSDALSATLQKQKGNFQPDRVTSVAASMPNNVHTSRSVTLFDQYR